MQILQKGLDDPEFAGYLKYLGQDDSRMALLYQMLCQLKHSEK